MLEEYINLALTEPWRKEALCKGKTNLFFNEDTAKNYYGRARALCQICPVKKECLDYAIDNHEAGGFWGGMTYKERYIEARRRRRL